MSTIKSVKAKLEVFKKKGGIPAEERPELTEEVTQLQIEVEGLFELLIEIPDTIDPIETDTEKTNNGKNDR